MAYGCCCVSGADLKHSLSIYHGIKYRVYIKETECYESGCYKVKIDFETIEEAKYFISNILCTKTARRTTKREIVYIKNCEL